MNKSLIGSLCIVFGLACGPAARAQEQPPQAPPERQQDTPQEQTTPQEPRARTTEPPPAPPRMPDIRQPGEHGFYVGLGAWFPVQQPVFDKGHASTFLNPSHLVYQGKPKYSPSAEIGIAAGAHNTVRIAYFDTKANGDFVPGHDITALGQTYPAGTLVSTDYRIRNAKVSFDFLTWPFPVESRRFRLKTLWQLQYTQIHSVFNAPQMPLYDSAGNRLADASGNALSYVGQKTRSLILPAVGIGMSEYLSPRVRLEANASGFAIPHHGNLWDADATINFRVNHFELRMGAKAFHFNTSAAPDYYSKATLYSAFGGIRWYSD